MELTIVLAVVVALVLILWWITCSVINEAERKLGRPLTAMEVILGASASPYSIIYVLWFMPESKPKRK